MLNLCRWPLHSWGMTRSGRGSGRFVLIPPPEASWLCGAASAPVLWARLLPWNDAEERLIASRRPGDVIRAPLCRDAREESSRMTARCRSVFCGLGQMTSVMARRPGAVFVRGGVSSSDQGERMRGDAR